MKKQITTYIAILLIAIAVITGGFYIYQSLATKPKSTPIATKTCVISNDNKTITYNGEEGTTALDLLIKKCTVESNGTGESAYVTSINGITANSANEFWSFKINGEMAAVGAGSYITKNSDTITWELSSF